MASYEQEEVDAAVNLVQDFLPVLQELITFVSNIQGSYFFVTIVEFSTT